jgi:hypothetical protein
MMLVEAGVLGRYHSVLEFERDPRKRHEHVAFLIWLLVNQRLDPPLNVHGCERRGKPTEDQKG